ncbi:uncharacterized protein [Coffea arabica]|uniref:Uncharacterized protein n=1 Tax=Coffea arabica TaxID=13443 RepID=A0A6P6WU47_COFAR
MSIIRHKYKPINTSGEHEGIPIATVNRKPVRRICKCQSSVLAELGEKGKLQDTQPRFGPFYRQDEPAVNGKKEAWDKVLEKSEDRNKTKEDYLFAIRRIEKRARAIYADADSGDLDDLTESEFRWMMIKDGCFFLQLALFILGVPSMTLGYSSNHIIFGKKRNNEDVKKWIQAMFFVGNQLPLLVLNELMKQRFFQTILPEVDKETPADVPRRILYESLIFPAREYMENQTITSPTPRSGQQQPSDLLLALHISMCGLGGILRNANLLANETENVDLEAGRGVNQAKDLTFSAMELKKKGIYFQKEEKVGCTCTHKINFNDCFLFSRLYLPVFTVDDDTELVFKSLKLYEVSQGNHERQVRSYLHLMSDLICTYEDVKLLAETGIIKADNLYLKEQLPTILGNMVGQDKINTSDHPTLRVRLRDYNTAPWEKFKIVAFLIFVFTAVQTFFALFGYIRPPH